MPAGGGKMTPRQLLANVRDIMAGRGSAQKRLDQVVSTIAGGLGAEVCSVYVRRAGDVLELFATEGLRSSAVHQTRLRVGEGLIGVIAARARPLALADAQHHPAFAFRPETGEEVYHSLMGVPILRDGRIIGVVAVQNRSERRYRGEEIETLQTVAMILAELIAGGSLIALDELPPAEGLTGRPQQVPAVRLSPGVGIGIAVLGQLKHDIHNLVAEDPEVERSRLRAAFTDMHGALDALFQASDHGLDGEHREILESYRMIAEDAGWFARIQEAIDGGLTAEAAVMKVHNDIRARLRTANPYLQERIHDFQDLADRLLQHLTGADGSVGDIVLPENAVLIARSLGPAQLLELDRSRLAAVVLEEGTATAHVAIIARALNIPMVGQARDIFGQIVAGDPVIVDAEHGNVFVRPGDTVRQAFMESAHERERQIASYRALQTLPAETLDGVEVRLNINAGLRIDLAQLEETGAEGVGLYRTELLFLSQTRFPDVAAQQALYADILDKAEGRPVVFRTVDVGGDKILPYLDTSRGDNPAMGWRAIRMCLDRPAILRQQLRALIRAAAGRELRLMFPMVADVAEFDSARALLDLEMKRENDRTGRLPASLSVGAMLEVPSLMFQLDMLLKKVQFVSVGSNDLLQFLFASDRANPGLSTRYDSLSPAMIRLLGEVAQRCEKAGTSLSLCGEMAGNPLDAMVLVGLGYRDLSMAPSSIGPVKAMIRSLNLGGLRRYIEVLYDSPEHSLREKLRDFARDHHIAI